MKWHACWDLGPKTGKLAQATGFGNNDCMQLVLFTGNNNDMPDIRDSRLLEHAEGRETVSPTMEANNFKAQSLNYGTGLSKAHLSFPTPIPISPQIPKILSQTVDHESSLSIAPFNKRFPRKNTGGI